MHTIRSRWLTFCTGQTADGRQGLLGWCADFIAVLLFDETGNLLTTEAHPLGIKLEKGLGPAVEEIADRKIRAVRRELGFRKGPIRVKPFFIEGWKVGLKLFPDDLEEFLADPHSFAEEEAAIFRADVARWEADGNCVLVWGNSYHLGRDGNTI